MRSQIVRYACLIVALLAHARAFAQEAPPVRTLTQGDDVLQFPSIGRVLFAFALAAALAVGVAYVLRQVLPKLGKAMPVSGRLRVVDRVHLNNALRVHLVEVEGQRVLVAENRGAITMVTLPPTNADSSQQP